METIDFEAITLRKEIGSRGGGMEIDLTTLGFKGKGMTAFQNYLGGGMLGKVTADCNVQDWRSNVQLKEISEQLKEHFFNLTNPEEDAWESVSYLLNQNMPISAY